jgi:Zn-dependent peptidase ImmA (M78 family)
MPKAINGYVFNYRNINCIVLNKNKSLSKKKETLLHELAHIELNQLEQIDNDLFAFKIDGYEDEADKYVKILLKNIEEEVK